MESKLSLNINSRLYLRNPEETELGQRIIAQSVDLIEAIGIELFTFKKLATNINSTEASIYRYFENKHNLLIYLISVHWVLKEEQLQAQLQKLNTQKEKLEAIISVLVAVPIELNLIKHRTHLKSCLVLFKQNLIKHCLPSKLTKTIDRDILYIIKVFV